MQYEDFPTLRQSLEDAKPGSFVEFEATLRKNPLIETLEDITSMYNMFVSPETTPTTNIPATAQKRSKTSNTSNQKQKRVNVRFRRCKYFCPNSTHSKQLTS